MKFKEAYRNTNENIHARKDLLEEIKMERVERIRSEQQKKRSLKPWLIAIPSVAAAAAACIAIVVGVRAANLRTNAAPEAKSADASYTELFGAEGSSAQNGIHTPAAVASYEVLSCTEDNHAQLLP